MAGCDIAACLSGLFVIFGCWTTIIKQQQQTTTTKNIPFDWRFSQTYNNKFESKWHQRFLIYHCSPSLRYNFWSFVIRKNHWLKGKPKLHINTMREKCLRRQFWVQTSWNSTQFFFSSQASLFVTAHHMQSPRPICIIIAHFLTCAFAMSNNIHSIYLLFALCMSPRY